MVYILQTIGYLDKRKGLQKRGVRLNVLKFWVLKKSFSKIPCLGKTTNKTLYPIDLWVKKQNKVKGMTKKS